MNENSAAQYLRQRVIGNSLCTHCGACVNLCPYFVSHSDRIVVLDHCDRMEGGCFDVCPRAPTEVGELQRLLFDQADLTPEAGAIKEFYVTRAADASVRANAQHGGTVTALMDLALKAGLIDTAILSRETEPLLPVGTTAAEAGEAGRLSKSHFVVSPNVATFNKVARGETKAIGVVATPCQALALAKMRVSRNVRVRENAKKLRLVIGLFCGWAFSWSALKQRLEDHRVDLNSIVSMDIPPSKYHALEVVTREGKVSISLDEVQDVVRSCCHYCEDMTSEFGDISVGSARLPEGWEEARSWNQTIVRSEEGRRLMDLARKQGVLEFREVPEGNLKKLKEASLNKKKGGTDALKTMNKSNDSVH